jgi:hypothetical protein
LEELNGSLLREEEGLAAGRGLVASYTGSVASVTGGLLASGPDAAALNENQNFLLFLAPELRRKYEGTLLNQIEQVGINMVFVSPVLKLSGWRPAAIGHIRYNQSDRSREFQM